MPQTCDAVPNDIDALTSGVLDQGIRIESLAHHNTQLQSENQRIKAQVLLLQEQLHIAVAINGS